MTQNSMPFVLNFVNISQKLVNWLVGWFVGRTVGRLVD
jgi:hypothetical protein